VVPTATVDQSTAVAMQVNSEPGLTGGSCGQSTAASIPIWS
jgi:hypothetical protein